MNFMKQKAVTLFIIAILMLLVFINSAAAAYNRNNATYYADYYTSVSNNNPNYYKFSQNCTNFVSQALGAGGLEQIYPTGSSTY
ncbi:MAG: amidase domain-containing protein [Syntrophomonadaceae bacterium]|jgi:hypothetical protein|nr:amidase domain-containing protein [Syntrophomonadaceae bacterium]